jgi:hypothetical protein
MMATLKASFRKVSILATTTTTVIDFIKKASASSSHKKGLEDPSTRRSSTQRSLYVSYRRKCAKVGDRLKIRHAFNEEPVLQADIQRKHKKVAAQAQRQRKISMQSER